MTVLKFLTFDLTKIYFNNKTNFLALNLASGNSHWAPLYSHMELCCVGKCKKGQWPWIRVAFYKKGLSSQTYSICLLYTSDAADE